MNSNRYLFRYAAVLVVIVAAVLSGTAMLLAPYQQNNQDDEKRCNILGAAGIDDVGDVKALFDQHCTAMLLLDAQGNVIDRSGKAFTADLKQELYNQRQGKPYVLPLFVVNDGQRDVNIVPLQGNGLWGAIWGYIAIAEDGNTVVGANFGHASETPGLGGEIATEAFQQQFSGKTLFHNGTFVSIKVKKGGILSLPEDERCHAVDAISGGSITSKGVDDMIDHVLHLYLPYFEKNKK